MNRIMKWLITRRIEQLKARWERLQKQAIKCVLACDIGGINILHQDFRELVKEMDWLTGMLKRDEVAELERAFNAPAREKVTA